MQDLPENHSQVSGASWVNIINYYYLFIITSSSHFSLILLKMHVTLLRITVSALLQSIVEKLS